MPKYLLQVNYTSEGAAGLIKEGGTKRMAAAKQAAESLGARIETMYFAFGATDVYVIVDAPDNATVAALTMALAASGRTTGRTTVLLTPEEMDRAASKHANYRPPGQ